MTPGLRRHAGKSPIPTGCLGPSPSSGCVATFGGAAESSEDVRARPMAKINRAARFLASDRERLEAAASPPAREADYDEAGTTRRSGSHNRSKFSGALPARAPDAPLSVGSTASRTRRSRAGRARRASTKSRRAEIRPASPGVAVSLRYLKVSTNRNRALLGEAALEFGQS